jgi:hypothetical protein
MNKENDVTAILIFLERAALDRWGKGDPSGYLGISAPDIVYDTLAEYPAFQSGDECLIIKFFIK